MKLKFKKNPCASIAFLLGILILIIGLCGLISGKSAKDKLKKASFDSSFTYAQSYRFGADFYTEMFGITYKMLDQLNGISSDIKSNFAELNKANVEAAFRVGARISWLTVALGVALCGISLCHMNENGPQDYSEQLTQIAALLRGDRDEICPEAPAPAIEEAGPAPEEPVPGTWVCSCQTVNTGSFCTQCGKRMPVPETDAACTDAPADAENKTETEPEAEPIPEEPVSETAQEQNNEE